MRRYFVQGVLFVQDELGYVEDGIVKSLLREKFDNLKIEEAQLAQVFDHLYDSGVLRELFKIILKPDRSTLIRRGLNRWQAWRHGVNMADPIVSMKNSEIAQVLIDFFDCNVSWMSNLQSSAHVSDFSDWTLIRKTLSNWKKRFTISPAKIFQSPN